MFNQVKLIAASEHYTILMTVGGSVVLESSEDGPTELQW